MQWTVLENNKAAPNLSALNLLVKYIQNVNLADICNI